MRQGGSSIEKRRTRKQSSTTENELEKDSIERRDIPTCRESAMPALKETECDREGQSMPTKRRKIRSQNPPLPRNAAPAGLVGDKKPLVIKCPETIPVQQALSYKTPSPLLRVLVQPGNMTALIGPSPSCSDTPHYATSEIGNVQYLSSPQSPTPMNTSSHLTSISTSASASTPDEQPVNTDIDSSFYGSNRTTNTAQHEKTRSFILQTTNISPFYSKAIYQNMKSIEGKCVQPIGLQIFSPVKLTVSTTSSSPSPRPYHDYIVASPAPGYSSAHAVVPSAPLVSTKPSYSDTSRHLSASCSFQSINSTLPSSRDPSLSSGSLQGSASSFYQAQAASSSLSSLPSFSTTSGHEPLQGTGHILSPISSGALSAQKTATISPRQLELTEQMRAMLVDWMVDAAMEQRLEPSTLCIAVQILDCIIQRMMIKRLQFQMIGCTCLLLASKIEEVQPMRIESLVYMSDFSFDSDGLIGMEMALLKLMDFDLVLPTRHYFLARYTLAVHLSEKEKNFMLYLLELSLLDYSLNTFRPSLIASSIIHFARQAMRPLRDFVWPAALSAHSGYDEEDMLPVILRLRRCHEAINESNFSASIKKFSRSEHSSVSLVVGSLRYSDLRFDSLKLPKDEREFGLAPLAFLIPSQQAKLEQQSQANQPSQQKLAKHSL